MADTSGLLAMVQIEQPAIARKDARVRDAVAHAVADLYLRQGDV